MSRITDEHDDLLKQHGAVLIRQSRHRIWRLPDGRNYVQSQTPGDFRAAVKQLTTLKRVLGIQEYKGAVGERRKKPNRNKGKSNATRPTPIACSSIPTFRDVLHSAVSSTPV